MTSVIQNLRSLQISDTIILTCQCDFGRTVVTLYVKLNHASNLKLNIFNESFSQVKFGLVKLNINLTRLIFTEVTLISQVRI